MKKYAVSKETFNYITSILANKPSYLLHDWEQWLNANSVGSESYNVIKELSHFNKNPSIVITELLQGKAELELDEKKYRIYHKQEARGLLFPYHFFNKKWQLDETNKLENIPTLTESQVQEIACREGEWVWSWAYEVTNND